MIKPNKAALAKHLKGYVNGHKASHRRRLATLPVFICVW